LAGIGITLRELFSRETVFDRIYAYSYSALIAAGPWISAVFIVNLIILLSQHFIVIPYERFLFMSTIVYSFVVSQIITAPWQFINTRYIADKLFKREYDFIRPTFIGNLKLILVISIIIVVLFYYYSPLPIYYTYIAGVLFILLSIIWTLMVFLSAVKGYKMIGFSFISGGLVSVILTVVFLVYPIGFPYLSSASNMLLAYSVGVFITLMMLLHSFFQAFNFGNVYEFDFLRYFNKLSILFFIGLFYTLGIWIDSFIVWYGVRGEILFETYRFSSTYDHAKFLAFLTTIPAVVLFMVYVETAFYEKFKNFYQTVRGGSTLAVIEDSKKKLSSVLYTHLIYLIERQMAISITIIVLSEYIFIYLGFSVLLRDVFRILALAALANSLFLSIMLILLYFEARKEALISSFLFLFLNAGFTLFFEMLGENYQGFGLFLASTLALIVSLCYLIKCIKNLEYNAFAMQPLFILKEHGFFINLADWLNKICARVNQEGRFRFKNWSKEK